MNRNKKRLNLSLVVVKSSKTKMGSFLLHWTLRSLSLCALSFSSFSTYNGFFCILFACTVKVVYLNLPSCDFLHILLNLNNPSSLQSKEMDAISQQVMILTTKLLKYKVCQILLFSLETILPQIRCSLKTNLSLVIVPKSLFDLIMNFFPVYRFTPLFFSFFWCIHHLISVCEF